MRDDRHVAPVSGMSRGAIEQAGLRFLQRFAPECLEGVRPLPVRAIFEDDIADLDVVPVIEVFPEHIHGLTDPHTRRVSLNKSVHEGVLVDDGRCRFAAAHEFGHVYLHMEQLAKIGTQLVNGGGGVRLYRRTQIPAYLDPEWQANAFAASILMPAPALYMLMRRLGRVPRAYEISSTFKVSLTAASYRIVNLDLPGRVNR